MLCFLKRLVRIFRHDTNYPLLRHFTTFTIACFLSIRLILYDFVCSVSLSFILGIYFATYAKLVLTLAGT